MYSGDKQQSEPNEDESLQRLKKIRGGNRAKTTKLMILCDNDKVVEDDQTYSKYVNGAVKTDDQLQLLGIGLDNSADTLQVELSGGLQNLQKPSL